VSGENANSLLGLVVPHVDEWSGRILSAGAKSALVSKANDGLGVAAVVGLSASLELEHYDYSTCKIDNFLLLLQPQNKLLYVLVANTIYPLRIN